MTFNVKNVTSAALNVTLFHSILSTEECGVGPGGGCGGSESLVGGVTPVLFITCCVSRLRAAFKSETEFNLQLRESRPLWIVGFHNCPPLPLPSKNRASWEFNYEGNVAADPAGLERSRYSKPVGSQIL